jgi:hypothetical protein
MPLGRDRAIKPAPEQGQHATSKRYVGSRSPSGGAGTSKAFTIPQSMP